MIGGVILFCVGGYVAISLAVIVDQHNYINYLENREDKKDLIDEYLRSDSRD